MGRRGPQARGRDPHSRRALPTSSRSPRSRGGAASSSCSPRRATARSTSTAERSSPRRPPFPRSASARRSTGSASSRASSSRRSSARPPRAASASARSPSRSGIVSAEKLFAMMAQQVEEVFFAAVHVSEGAFYFFDRFDEKNILRRHSLNAGGLLLEAARRMDEMRFFREKVPERPVHPGAGRREEAGRRSREGVRGVRRQEEHRRHRPRDRPARVRRHARGLPARLERLRHGRRSSAARARGHRRDVQPGARRGPRALRRRGEGRRAPRRAQSLRDRRRRVRSALHGGRTVAGRNAEARPHRAQHRRARRARTPTRGSSSS